MSDSDLTSEDFPPLSCKQCERAEALGFDFTMAFQPIVDLEAQEIFAYEALVRGKNGESAGSILARIDDSNRYRFDQACRVKAVKLASELGVQARLSINFMPNAIYKPESCIRTTLAATETYGFPETRIIFEVTESEKISDKAHLQHIFDYYKSRGFLTAIDDFGAGYAGLALLAEFQPNVIKLDMDLIRDIDDDVNRQAIADGVIGACDKLGIDIIAEGIESKGELDYLYDRGVRKFQGFLFARPQLEALPEPRMSGW
jgi:EAL domain-containing protein (putative c-di-GMP-specific phosphodiesterase class I)